MCEQERLFVLPFYTVRCTRLMSIVTPLVEVLQLLHRCSCCYFLRRHRDHHHRLHHPRPLPVLDLSYLNNFDQIDAIVHIHLRHHWNSYARLDLYQLSIGEIKREDKR